MKIDINAPCHENWDGMGPNPKGKHCSKCEKTVYDFSKYADAEIVDFFKDRPNVCGRFNASQLGRDLTQTRPHSSKWAIAACGVLLLSSGSINAQTHLQVGQDSSLESIAQKSIQLTRVLYTSFYEASTRDACISKMRLTIDSFSIEVDIDSSRKAVVTIPQTLSGERVDILLIDFKGDTFHLEAVNIGEGDIVFTPLASGSWNYTLPMSNLWHLPEPPIIHTMGIPSPYIWGPPVLPNVYINNPIDSLTISMGYTVLSDSIVKPDSIKRTVKSGGRIRQKQDAQFGPWVIGIAIGILGLMALAWRKFKHFIKA